MCEVTLVAPGCNNPLVELCGHRRPAGAGEQHATCLLFFIERAGHGKDLWPGPWRLQMVLCELLSIVVGNLHIRPEGQEIPHPAADSYGHEGGVDGLLHLALLRSERGSQGRIDQFLKTHIVLCKKVDLYAPSLVHRPQALHHRFWWDVDSPDATVACRLKPRQH